MPKTSPDHPNVIIFPPLILATTVTLGCLLQWLLPLGQLMHASQIWRGIAGGIAILGGVSLAVAGRRMLVQLGTNVSPLRPTTALATDGIYKWTRNPLYTGGALVMFGIALFFALDWLVLLIAPSVLILHLGVVSREEQYLEQKFGDKYRRYKTSVARYGLGI
jgi:protein-S-isoprenylcysteine O-methyltransferase Ste14